MKHYQHTVIDRFIVQSIIGTGGTGRVYRVKDPRNNHNLALKITNVEEGEESGSLLPRFRREFAVARKLNHPNLIRVYEFGSTNSQLFYTMELIDGAEWTQHLHAYRQNLNEHEPEHKKRLYLYILALLIQAANALCHLHKNGIIHRDIKPGNLLITRNGVVKITDFGTMRKDDSIGQLTRTGSILGTVAYMSPEQTMTSRVDHRSDIYSLGLMAYESFVHRTPFEGTVMKQILVRTRQDIPDPRRYMPELPAQIADILNRMLQRRPEDRFETAEILEKHLRAARDILQQTDLSRQTGLFRKILHITDPPLVGCDAELNRTQEALQTVSSEPMPRIFFVQGGIGTGKTRLAAEIKMQAELIGRTVYGEPGKKTELLETAVAAGVEDVTAQTHPEQVTRHLFRLFCRQPGLLILENLHQRNKADRDIIIAFLKYLVQQSLVGESCPLVILVTIGDHDSESRVMTRTIRRIMRNYDNFSHFRLKHLAPEETRIFIDLLLPGYKEIFDLPDRLHAVTGGNPFHVEHAIRKLVSDETIRYNGSVWLSRTDAGFGYLSLAGSDTPIELVRYAHELYSDLTGEEKAIVQTASIFPGRFNVDKIAAIRNETVITISQKIESLMQKGVFQAAPGVHQGFMFTSPVVAAYIKESVEAKNIRSPIDSAEDILDLFTDDSPVMAKFAAADLAIKLHRQELASNILVRFAEEWYSRGWINSSLTAWRYGSGIRSDMNMETLLACRLGIGQCLVHLGFWQQALLHWNETAQISSNILNSLKTPKRTLTRLHIRIMLQQADTKRRTGFCEDAEKQIVEYMNITRQSSDLADLHREALAVRGRIRRHEGDFSFSEAIFHRLIQQTEHENIRSACNRYRLDKGIILLKNKKPENARVLFEDINDSNINPTDILLKCRANLYLGDAWAMLEQSGNAQNYWETAAQLAENEMFPLERAAALLRYASLQSRKSREEYVFRAQAILSWLNLEEAGLDAIV
jgi:eukaryotic-like serine/threonine-protein kinase